MKIDSVQKYKGTTYEILLDDGRKFYLHADIIADFGLRSELEVTQDELRKIIYASNFRRAFQYALHLLDYRDYSFREMFGKLSDTYKSEKLCFAVMKKLSDIGVINDLRLAEKLAEKYVMSKRFGFHRAKREMTGKGLDADTAENALFRYEENFGENLMYLLETKHSRLLTDKDDRKSVEKVKNALLRYGYGYDEINRSVREYFERAEYVWEED